ncbi:MAG: hypothetical protein C4K60_04090 [Ideonella sp. MAG2]|nr:MAG: hypothetical protein C4K60_04090 [Ideonella sp. MAG2]
MRTSIKKQSEGLVIFASALANLKDFDHALRASPPLRGALWQAELGLLPAELEACRAWGVESENRPQRDQFLPNSQPHSPAMGQEGSEKWAAAADLQPTLPKSDRLLGRAPHRPPSGWC